MGNELVNVGGVWTLKEAAAGGGGMPEPVGSFPFKLSGGVSALESDSPKANPLVGIWDSGGTGIIHWSTGHRVLGNAAVSLGANVTGGDDYFEVPYNSAFDFEYNDAFSVSIWLRALASNSVVISHQNAQNIGNVLYRGWMIWIDASGRIEFSLRSDNVPNYSLIKQSTTDIRNAWHHVVVAYDGVNATSLLSGVDIYINGTEESTGGTETLGTNTTQHSGLLLLGAQQTSASGVTKQYPGIMDDCAIWNVHLKSTHVAALYNSGAGALANTILPGDIVAYYPFDHPSSPYTHTADAGPSSNNLHAQYKA